MAAPAAVTDDGDGKADKKFIDGFLTLGMSTNGWASVIVRRLLLLASNSLSANAFRLRIRSVTVDAYNGNRLYPKKMSKKFVKM